MILLNYYNRSRYVFKQLSIAYHLTKHKIVLL